MVVVFAGNRKSLDRLSVAGLAAMVCCVQAGYAQTPAPAKPASSAEISTPYLNDYVPSEALKRQALGPLRIIQSLGNAANKKEKDKAASPALAPAVSASSAAKTPLKEAVPKVAAPVPANSPIAPQLVSEPDPPQPVPAAAAAVQAASIASAPVITKPRRTELIPVRQDPPKFSPSLMRDSQRATVKVAFDVTEQGDTANPQVVASTNRRLNTAATDAVAKWKFEPLDDAVRVEIDLVFNNE